MKEETNAPEGEQETQLTPEEYAKQKKDAIEHYTGEIEYLEVECKYHKLIADIEEHKTRGLGNIRQRAMFFAQDNPNGTEKPPEGQQGPMQGGQQVPPMAEAPVPVKPEKPRKLKPQK
jgi:hypothetical protein